MIFCLIDLYDVPGVYEAEVLLYIFYLEMLSVSLILFYRNPQWSLYLPVAVPVPVRRTSYMCSIKRYT